MRQASESTLTCTMFSMMTKYGEYQLRAASALSLEDLLTKLKRYYRTSEVILLLTGENEWSVAVRGLTLRKAKVFRKFSAFELLEK